MTTTTKKKEGMRTCRICSKEKPLKRFEIDKRLKGGHSNRCKSCKTGAQSKAKRAFYRLTELQDKYPIPIETDRQEFEKLFEICSDHCSYCGKEYEGTPTFDHITPKSMEGSRHHIGNLQLTCSKCNKSKGDRPLYVFFENNPDFSEVRLYAVIFHIAHFTDRYVFEVMDELQEQYLRYQAERLVVAS